MEFDFRESLAFALVQAAKAHLRVAGVGLAAYGLQVGQDMFLFQLWAEDGLTQSELVRRLGVEPPTVTKALRRLERIGLITRRRDPGDARALRVYLTPRGRRLERPVARIWAELEARERSALGDAAHNRLRQLAMRMRDALAQARPEHGASRPARSRGA
jgi:DNA-binding MarR family transcriptional regulator